MAWQLWRADIYGNEFFVRSFDERGSAEAERAVYVARGHHQTYWVTEAADAPTGNDADASDGRERGPVS